MLLSTSFLLVLAAIERAMHVSAVSDEVFRRAIGPDPGSDLLWHHDTVGGDPASIPQPVRPGRGAPIIIATNLPLQYQNSDTAAPPSTDGGSVKNMKASLANGRTGLFPFGYSRQVSSDNLPVSTDISGGNLRQRPGTTRVLHWHDATEWGYVLTGASRVTAVTPEGQSYVADVPAGDLWNFPHSIPHSIQALNVETEIIVAFDFSDVGDGQFTLGDWLQKTPKLTLAKNFGWTDPTVFNYIPTMWIHSYNGTVPPARIEDDWVIPNNVPHPYTFEWSKVPATKAPGGGGSFRIADSKNFKASNDFAVLEVTVEPGRMRELHYHPFASQWTFFITGEARMTVFAPGVGNARTFNFLTGDVGYVPRSYGHYIENTGNSTLKFLEIVRSNVYEDISVHQWMALAPRSLIKGHFNFPDAIIDGFKQAKQWIV